jgi:hypothetical protein
MRFSARSAWVLLTVALASLVVVLLAGSAPASCRKAGEKRESRLIGEAESTYAAVLKAEPGSECATDGLRAVMQLKCHRADRLRHAKLKDEARKLYTAVLTADRPNWNGKERPRWSGRCATNGLAHLPPDPPPGVGPKGDKGDKGETGDAGDAGEKGDPGKQGETGNRGPAGRVDVYLHGHKCKPPRCKAG